MAKVYKVLIVRVLTRCFFFCIVLVLLYKLYNFINSYAYHQTNLQPWPANGY